MNNQNSATPQKIQKLNAVTLVIIPVAFVLFAGLVGFIVNNIRSSVKTSTAIFNEAGVPLAWNNSINPATDIVSGVSAELVNYEDHFVQYSPFIKNTGSSAHYLTHLASYLTSTSGDSHGFAPLNEATIEYTYTPEDQDSWTHLAISAPSNTHDGFKLSTPLYLSADGSPMNTIYFRYGVSADITHSDHLTDEVSFIITDESKSTESLSTTKTSLAYEAPDSANGTVIATTDPSDSDGTTTKPLGVVSYVSNTDIIASVHTSDSDSSQSTTFISSQALLIIILTVFCSAALLYIPFRHLR